MRRHTHRSTTQAGLGSRRVSNSGFVATFALIELAEFLRSVLRSSEILLQNDKTPTAQAPRCSTQRAGIAPPHAAGEGLSGATSDGEFGFISGPAAFVGGVPLTRAMNPWAMPEAST